MRLSHATARICLTKRILVEKMKHFSNLPQSITHNGDGWHQLYFDWDDVVDGCLDSMQQQFEMLWARAGKPDDAALFANRLVTGGRHIYFSPGACRVAPTLLERYVGLRCEKPAQIKPALLVEQPRAAARLLGPVE